MKHSTIKYIIRKIKDLTIISINQKENEEGSGLYNVWEINCKDQNYILKQSTENELKNYQILSDCEIPKLYGFTTYYKKIYLLIEHLNGFDLRIGNLENSLLAVNSIINVSKKFLDSDVALSDTFSNEIKRIENRGKYLKNELLESKYAEFINLYKISIKTACHNDLLPFNIMIANNKAYFIDLEYMGYLPYLAMFSRFIAHYKEEPGYLFYLEEDVKNYLIRYYYDEFVSGLNKSFEEYYHELKLFLLFEYTEWVYVYNRYKIKKDERYNYYLNKALDLFK